MFDCKGKILYDKDYMSNIDDTEEDVHLTSSDDLDMKEESEPEPVEHPG